MFLTPPDVLSQTLLALPMYGLYEGGLLMARLMLPERVAAAAAAEAAEAAEAADEAD
jgi:sec-independent protein translocase protein TatC